MPLLPGGSSDWPSSGFTAIRNDFFIARRASLQLLHLMPTTTCPRPLAHPITFESEDGSLSIGVE